MVSEEKMEEHQEVVISKKKEQEGILKYSGGNSWNIRLLRFAEFRVLQNICYLLYVLSIK